MEAYCMKCRSKEEMDNPVQVDLKNGRPASKGTCGKCGGSVYRIGPVSLGNGNGGHVPEEVGRPTSKKG